MVIASLAYNRKYFIFKIMSDSEQNIFSRVHFVTTVHTTILILFITRQNHDKDPIMDDKNKKIIVMHRPSRCLANFVYIMNYGDGDVTID